MTTPGQNWQDHKAYSGEVQAAEEGLEAGVGVEVFHTVGLTFAFTRK